MRCRLSASVVHSACGAVSLLRFADSRALRGAIPPYDVFTSVTNISNSLFLDNCHSHVAHVLNAIRYKGRDDWNMMRVWGSLLREGRWLSLNAAFWTYLPLACVLALAALAVGLGKISKLD